MAQTIKNKGFASMPSEQVKQIASKGGKALAKRGKEYMRTIGSKGGSVAQQRNRQNRNKN